MNWKIRDADREDIKEIYQLYVDNEEIIPDLYPYEDFEKTVVWEYFENVFNLRHFIVAEDDKKKIIACYGMMPLKVIKDNKEYTAGLPCSLLVDKKYRKELLFLNLALKLLSEYKEKGISFSYAMAVRDGLLEAHIASGYKKIGNLPVFAKPINFVKAGREYFKNKILFYMLYLLLCFASLIYSKKKSINQSEFEKIHKFDESINNFFRNFSKKYNIIGLRNDEILNWRFNRLSYRNYECYNLIKNNIVKGFLALRVLDMKAFKALAIVDIAAEEEESYKCLLNFSHNKALDYKCDLISVLFNPELSVIEYFKSSGYRKTPKSFSLIVHKPRNSDISFENDVLKNWYITWFDHDYV